MVCSNLESKAVAYCFLFQDAPPAQGKGLQEVLQDCFLGIVFFVVGLFVGLFGVLGWFFSLLFLRIFNTNWNKGDSPQSFYKNMRCYY